MPLLFSIGALAVAHLFDYVSFLLMVKRHGLAAEANPVVISVAEELGLPGVTLAKLAVVAFAALATVVLARRRRGLARAVVVLGVVAGLIGGLSNVATL